MYSIIFSVIIEMFKALIPFLDQKLNEPYTATDSPNIPKHIRDAWLRQY